MSFAGIDYPSYTHDESVSDYQNINTYCSAYVCRIFEAALRLKRPAEPERISDHEKNIQQKLILREKKIRSHIRFNINKCFADYKSLRRQRGVDDITNIGLFSGQELNLMAPVAEMMMIKAQTLHTAHQQQLERIEQHLKTMAYLNEVDACDNPLEPLNLFNLILSSIDLEYLSIGDIQELVALIDRVFTAQLGDLYAQIEVGLAEAGYQSSQVPVDLPVTIALELARPTREEQAKTEQVQPIQGIKNLQTQAQFKAELFSMTEELLEDLILDDNMMVFFFDEWQRWLRHLFAEYGFESEEMRSAFKVLGALSRMLEHISGKKPNPSALNKIEKYLTHAWNRLNIAPDHYRNVLEQLKGLEDSAIQSLTSKGHNTLQLAESGRTAA